MLATSLQLDGGGSGDDSSNFEHNGRCTYSHYHSDETSSPTSNCACKGSGCNALPPHQLTAESTCCGSSSATASSPTLSPVDCYEELGTIGGIGGSLSNESNLLLLPDGFRGASTARCTDHYTGRTLTSALHKLSLKWESPTSRVWACTMSATPVIAKEVDSDDATKTDQLFREYQQLRSVQQSVRLVKGITPTLLAGFVRPVCVLETCDSLALITEYLDGYSLHDKLAADGPFSEKDAMIICKRLCRLLKTLHAARFVHRDIKLSNVVLRSNDSLASASLVDFGFSTSFDDEIELMRLCGSPGCCAPEILLGCSISEPQKLDAFSLGVLLFTLMSGTPPFAAESLPVLLRLNCLAQIHFNKPIWENISSEAKDMIESLMQRSPTDRLSASDALVHPWLCRDDDT